MQLATEIPTAQTAGNSIEIELPSGLIGLPQLRRFEILRVDDGWPFLSLRSLDDGDFHFLAVEPHQVIEDYAVELASEDVVALELDEPDDALVYNIVTVHNSPLPQVTANLIGPLVVNRNTNRGKQVILTNSERYSAKHPLIGGGQPSFQA